MALPKLKTIGKVTARPSTKAPSDRVSDYLVEQRIVDLRNRGATRCVVVYRRGQNPAVDGLHLAYDAARALRVSIEDAVRAGGTGGTVEILNHRFQLPSVWARFSAADAVVLADMLAGAAGPP